MIVQVIQYKYVLSLWDIVTRTFPKTPVKFGAHFKGVIGIGNTASEAINNCMNLFKEIGTQGYAGPIVGESEYVNTK